jgi:hypothetical protein
MITRTPKKPENNAAQPFLSIFSLRKITDNIVINKGQQKKRATARARGMTAMDR